VAQQLGHRGASALYVLSRNNDPFAKGTPAHVRDAEWFADVFHSPGFTNGVHLRRIHYRLDATGGVFPSGEPYRNTEECWIKLCMAGTAARILRTVDAEAFVDRRNKFQAIHRERRDPAETTTPSFGFTAPTWRLPELDPDVLLDVELELPEPVALGYGYHHDDQPVLLEVWVEKSTVQDVLIPVCRAAHVNYVEGAGFESITHVVELVRRAERHHRPAHVLYVSDFDPAGDQMPVAVARQVQYWREALGVDEHVSVEPIVLTRDQVIEHELPREPIKESDRRAGGFEERYGEGATELDALEALHPGLLAGIVRDAIRPHVDSSLRGRLNDARFEATSRIEEAWEQESAALRDEAERLTVEARDALADNADEIMRLVAEQLGTLGPFEERATELVRQAERLAARLDLALPARPDPEIAGPDEQVLFDSRRHWVDQLTVFKARQNGHGNGVEP
jgi:hypothetical protein